MPIQLPPHTDLYSEIVNLSYIIQAIANRLGYDKDELIEEAQELKEEANQ